MAWPMPLPGRPFPAPGHNERVAALAAVIFSAALDHAPHAHAFEYSEQTVLDATASARQYAVAQARALLAEVDRPPAIVESAELQRITRERDALLEFCRPCDIEAAHASLVKRETVSR